MSKSTTLITKKRRGPAPTGQGKMIGVRLHADILDPLDTYIASQPDKPSRPEAIRRILKGRLG